ncbi:TLC domain-containing protein At5g14285-like [Juglans microcarpa x Juglans regia]|uniref:TLC domain-containing protein At5g14285-like n=1 Tax=Juglans microcarpa x Juglans regia TaxID=2249226 RepID=UPI001B7E2E41|nr:TLC domain-containing protein At5g14285-like [Juglans microcarpa x Juglans regia]
MTALKATIFSLFSHNRSERSDGGDSGDSNLVIDYSIAYFLMDLFHFIVFNPRDLIFIANHLVTLFAFLTCRYLVSHGTCAILVLLILAEVTCACQNNWTLVNAWKNDVVFATKLYGLLSAPFYTVYSIVRGLVGPYFVYKMFTFYSSGAAKSVIPKWVWVSWIAVILTAISVSILWVSNLWFTEKERENWRTGFESSNSRSNAMMPKVVKKTNTVLALLNNLQPYW